MPEIDSLNNELRLRVPNKPLEFYVDSLRWAIDEICRKTSFWRVNTNIVTTPGDSVYDLTIPADSSAHSNLYIIDNFGSGQERVIKRPNNGFITANLGDSDYLQAFKSVSGNKIEIFPTPVAGGANLRVVTSITPNKGATTVDSDELFSRYSDTIVYGALMRCFEDSDIKKAEYFGKKFKNGVYSIKVDVIKEFSNTPLKMSASW